MPTILRITEAASLALHAMSYIAAFGDKPISTGKLAKELCASSAHLSKVMQRLTHVGLLKSIRGPSGGFILTKPATKIRFLDVYEAIEGPFSDTACLFDSHVCPGKLCVLSSLLQNIHKEVKSTFQNTTLDKASKVFK